MSTSIAQEVNTNNTDRRESVVSSQEITSRKWKFDSIFKVIAGIIYGFFFGMLPATFIFNGSIEASNPPIYEISAIVALLAISTLSLALIFWLFKGDIKKKHPLAYALVHVLNAAILSVGITVVSAISNYSESNNVDRYLILAIAYGAWALIMAIVSVVTMSVYKKQYPLSWSRAPFAIFSFLFAGLVELFIYLSANIDLKDGLNNQSILFAVLGLVSFVIALLVFGLATAFIKRYRDVLLGERTEYEIDTIRDWESARVFALIMSSAMILTYSVALIINQTISFSQIPLFVEIAIDVILVVPYIIIISYIKIQNMKNSNQGFYISRIFKTIDNGLLLDVFAWIIVVKSALIQGIYYDDNSITSEIKALMLIITFASLLVLYAFTTIIQVNIPNLRNTAITIPTLSFALILGLFTILFGGYLYRDSNISDPEKLTISPLVFVFMSVIVLAGMSISLVIKICMVAKIFKSNWKKEEQVDKSELAQKQAQDVNDLIGERTKEVDIEAIKQTKNKQQVQEFRTALNESIKD